MYPYSGQTILASTALMACVSLGVALPAKGATNSYDPAGILRKPIPDKLVVLSFDDSPASHATIVAPILKSMGFGGTIYVCNFDSFKTRKDWYMTYRQMKALADEGFEIGNHTHGHYGNLNAFLEMEDELAAHDIPKPTTACWPVYAVNWGICPTLSKNGYTFGRGGHERPYRPTIDNPFDVPSFTIRNGPPLEAFVNQARQACKGRVVVFTYHGVPDMEHPGVSLDPAVFKMQMQYLKNNHYKVIAMRDLAEYIDPVQAAKLPPTIGEWKDIGPVVLASEETPSGKIKSVKTESRNETKSRGEKPVQKLPAPIGVVTPTDVGKPNVFTWRNAAGGNWSDASKWTDNLTSGSAPVAGGRADYVLDFNQHAACAVKNDLGADFLLNRIILGNGCDRTVLSGQSITFVKSRTNPVGPLINAGKCQRVDIDMPVILKDDLRVNTVPDQAPNCFLSFNNVISGPGALVLHGYGDPDVARVNFHDVHYGILQLNNDNTYRGGTMINGGKINVRKSDGLGTGPVTLDNFGMLSGDSVLANPVTVNNGTFFHCSLSGPIQVNCIAGFIGNCTVSGDMSGPGGLIMYGTNGTYLNMVPGGTVTLFGTNTYAGPTIVFPGNLIVKKAAGLYNADKGKWTPANITIHKAATLKLGVGGPGEFTGEQIGALLRNLTTAISGNGLMGGSVLCLDTTNAKETVTVSTDISDSKGPGGGAFQITKCGAGTLQLSGNNTYTGQTILESGALSVSSLNCFTQGTGAASSSLGAPIDIEAGEIVFGEEGKEGECALIYTGTGETSDRVINLAGKKSTVTFDQSGTGLLKLTSTLLISGYGEDKAIVLKGDTAGAGEFAGNIIDPYDRAGKARTTLTKTGAGLWTLSGRNTYSGQTTVAQGTLTVASAESLGPKTDVAVASGAKVNLNFNGRTKIHALSLGKKSQAAGAYSAATDPDFLTGKGTLIVSPAAPAAGPP